MEHTCSNGSGSLGCEPCLQELMEENRKLREEIEYRNRESRASEEFQAVERERACHAEDMRKLNLQLSEAERKGRDLCQMNGELLMTLHEIARGAGPYSRDKLEHATNTIEAMKQLAKNAIAIPEMRVGRPLEGK